MSKVNKLAIYINPVFRVLRRLPRGQVVSYKNLARICGVPSARNISWILRQNEEPDKMPCYKVVLSDGRLASGYKFGGPMAQKKKLIADGLEFEKGRIKNFLNHSENKLNQIKKAL